MFKIWNDELEKIDKLTQLFREALYQFHNPDKKLGIDSLRDNLTIEDIFDMINLYNKVYLDKESPVSYIEIDYNSLYIELKNYGKSISVDYDTLKQLSQDDEVK